MAIENINLFEAAARKKLRFQYKGQLSVEDLWDLNVESLDTIFKSLNAEAKAFQEDSLLNTRSKEQELVEIRIEIIKHIVQVKLDENNARAAARQNKEKRQRIMEIMKTKQDAQLEGMSIDELQQMLDNME